MKKLFAVSVILTLLFAIFSCTNQKNNEIVANDSVLAALNNSTEETSLNQNLDNKVGDWVEKGVECYSIVITTFSDGRTIGKSVKCKVMSIKSDRIKMKAIENVSLMESVGCDQMGLGYGETWWETEGDLFKTRDEAVEYLVGKKWYIK